MTRLTQVPTVNVSVTIRLSEVEMRALDALAGYGVDVFLEVFYKQMGKHYLQPHEAGLRSLFKTVRTELPPIVQRADNARRAFVLLDPVIRSRADHDALIARVEAKRAEA